jgi:peptide/nickel transport system permease protein
VTPAWSPRARRSAALALSLTRSFGAFLLTVAGAVALVHALLWAAPGSPVDLLPNDAELRATLTAQWHLDDPAPLRLGRYLADAARGDLGESLISAPGRPVTSLLAAPAARSSLWVLSAIGLSMLVASGLALGSGGRHRPVSWLARALSLPPAFLLAHLVVHIVNELTFAGMNAGWFSAPAWFALPAFDHPVRTALAIAVLAVGSGSLADTHRELEGALVRVRSSGFADAARARGEPTWPHVLSNLVPPLALMVSTRAAYLVGSLVILERVLLLRGLGATLWNASLDRDYPVALGATVLMATFVAGMRLLADAVRQVVDPRLRQVR